MASFETPSQKKISDSMEFEKIKPEVGTRTIKGKPKMTGEIKTGYEVKKTSETLASDWDQNRGRKTVSARFEVPVSNGVAAVVDVDQGEEKGRVKDSETGGFLFGWNWTQLRGEAGVRFQLKGFGMDKKTALTLYSPYEKEAYQFKEESGDNPVGKKKKSSVGLSLETEWKPNLLSKIKFDTGNNYAFTIQGDVWKDGKAELSYKKEGEWYTTMNYIENKSTKFLLNSPFVDGKKQYFVLLLERDGTAFLQDVGSDSFYNEITSKMGIGVGVKTRVFGKTVDAEAITGKRNIRQESAQASGRTKGTDFEVKLDAQIKANLSAGVWWASQTNKQDFGTFGDVLKQNSMGFEIKRKF